MAASKVSWINNGQNDIDQNDDGGGKQAQNQDDSPNYRVIALQNCVDNALPQSGPREYGLDDDSSAQLRSCGAAL